MYRVLYRKWRPQTFADVTGQPQVTKTLQQELIAGRIAHAYLFTGSRGTGKTTCAKILAKAINCKNAQNGEPCGECDICKGIDRGSITDVAEIDAASNNGVDHIRSLREEAGFTPAVAKYRVYIIDEVHMLSIGAFNALLKTLEEPPAHVVFILATTEVHKMPATILSRCQRFEFRRIAPQDSARRLEYIAEQEGAHLEPEAALLIARLADGALRDALSILDQCMGVDRHITQEVVCNTAGIAGREHLQELAQYIAKQESAPALEVIDRLYSAGKDMASLSRELSEYYRSMMLVKTMQDAQGLLAISQEEYAKLSEIAGTFSLAAVLHGLEILEEAMEKIHRGASGRITVELAVIRLSTPQLEATPQALLRRIEALEQRGAPPQPPEKPQKTAKEAPITREHKPKPEPEKREPPPAEAETVEQPPPNLEEARRLEEWPEILQILGGYSKAIATAFAGTGAFVSGEYVLIDAPSDSMAFELLRKSSQREQMRQAILKATGKVYKLGPYRKKEAPKSQSDPLQQLAEQAQQAGIEIQIKE